MKSAVGGELDEHTFFRPDTFSSPGALRPCGVRNIRVSVQAGNGGTREIFPLGLPRVSARRDRNRLADVSFLAIVVSRSSFHRSVLQFFPRDARVNYAKPR